MPRDSRGPRPRGGPGRSRPCPARGQQETEYRYGTGYRAGRPRSSPTGRQGGGTRRPESAGRTPPAPVAQPRPHREHELDARSTRPPAASAKPSRRRPLEQRGDAMPPRPDGTKPPGDDQRLGQPDGVSRDPAVRHDPGYRRSRRDRSWVTTRSSGRTRPGRAQNSSNLVPAREVAVPVGSSRNDLGRLPDDTGHRHPLLLPSERRDGRGPSPVGQPVGRSPRQPVRRSGGCGQRHRQRDVVPCAEHGEPGEGLKHEPVRSSAAAYSAPRPARGRVPGLQTGSPRCPRGNKHSRCRCVRWPAPRRNPDWLAEVIGPDRDGRRARARPATLGGRSSGWRWPGRWPAALRSCSPTRRPANRRPHGHEVWSCCARPGQSSARRS